MGILNYEELGEIIGGIINEFLMKLHVQLLIDIPEDTNEVRFEDNLNLRHTLIGDVICFYILISALVATFREMKKTVDFKPGSEEIFVDDVLGLIKNEILGGTENG